jgi:Ala-tRNA(Pro) deacylase
MTAHKTRTDLFTYLDQLGIKTQTLDHPAVFTVAESHEIEAALPGGHTKNLFLKDAKDRLFLVVAQGSTQVDLKKLPQVIGSGRLSFGKAELLLEVLGVEPGSVTVFSLINDVGQRINLVLDAALMAHDIINAHPLENTATTSIARDDLMRFIAVCGHVPKIVTLDGVGATA